MLVDELLDVKVLWQDAKNIDVNPADRNRILTFRVTNVGNGVDSYTLTPLSTIPGDGFDPRLVGVAIDSNKNGTYDPGADVLYAGGADDPLLRPDSSIVVFVLNDIPEDASDGAVGQSQLTASSLTGTGAPGTVIPAGGESGTDALVGNSGGNSSAAGLYQVSDALVSMVKSAIVFNLRGGQEPLPGATIAYTIEVSVIGSGTARGVVFADPIPPKTTYKLGSLTLNGELLSDAVDSDVGDVGGTAVNAVTVNLGDLRRDSALQTVAFAVIIE